jgi:hypothetical protein
MFVTVYYSLSEQGQKNDLIANGTGKRNREGYIEHGDDGFEEAVRLSEIDYDGRAVLVVKSMFDAYPHSGELVAAARAERAAADNL